MQLVPGPASAAPSVSALAVDYHANTRMSGAIKRAFKGHQVNYSDTVRQLVADAPLHLTGRSRVSLPSPRALTMDLSEAVASRHSGRWYGAGPLTLADLATLLFYGNGVTRTSGTDSERIYRRNVANSGGLGSVELYAISVNVTGLAAGIYHYDAVDHALVQLVEGHLRGWLAEMVLFQVEFADAAVALVLTSAVGRLQSKYGPRGYRLGLFDVGHVSQNLYLCAAGLGLELSATAGFIEDEVERAVGIDGVSDCALLMSLAGPRPSFGADVP